MAVFETSRPMVDGHHGVRPTTLFSRLLGAIVDWNDRRVTRDALSRLSDHELDDLGLTRGDIERLDGRLIR